MAAASSTGPMNVLNMRLKERGSPNASRVPHAGHCRSSTSGRSARKRRWQFEHSTRGSVNPSTCPDASHTLGCMRMAASSPSMSSRWWTIALHQRSFTLRLSSTPRGP